MGCNFGVCLSSGLTSWRKLPKTVAVRYYHLRRLRRFGLDTRAHLVVTLIITQLDYCNVVLPACLTAPVHHLVAPARTYIYSLPNVLAASSQVSYSSSSRTSQAASSILHNFDVHHHVPHKIWSMSFAPCWYCTPLFSQAHAFWFPFCCKYRLLGYANANEVRRTSLLLLLTLHLKLVAQAFDTVVWQFVIRFRDVDVNAERQRFQVKLLANPHSWGQLNQWSCQFWSAGSSSECKVAEQHVQMCCLSINGKPWFVISTYLDTALSAVAIRRKAGGVLLSIVTQCKFGNIWETGWHRVWATNESWKATDFQWKKGWWYEVKTLPSWVSYSSCINPKFLTVAEEALSASLS